MTKRTTVKNDKLVFTKIAPKAHIDAQNRIRLTDEAIEIIEKIYMDTNISLTQIASEMIIPTRAISARRVRKSPARLPRTTTGRPLRLNKEAQHVQVQN